MIIPLETEDRVASAMRQMDEVRVRHLPVIEEKKLLGLLSEDDLFQADDDRIPVGEFAKSFQRFSIGQHDHFFSALRLMAENKLSIVPVIDEKNFYLGSITGEDMIRASADTLSVGNPGGVIVLHVSEKDYSFAEISRLVESNDIKILSAGVLTLPGSNLLQITLKLNKINIEPVIQTFMRFDYDINAYYGENEKDEELLRDRFDSLMHYLNI